METIREGGMGWGDHVRALVQVQVREGYKM